MRVIITGGHGFVGGALARRIISRGTLRGEGVDELILADLFTPATSEYDGLDIVRSVGGDLMGSLPELFAESVDVVFHLASAVSSECERDFDLGMNSNLLTTRAVLRVSAGPGCQRGASSHCAVLQQHCGVRK